MSGARKDWRIIAAEMIEAGRFHLDHTSDKATVAAASFVFDEGILYLSIEGRAEIASKLREAAK